MAKKTIAVLLAEAQRETEYQRGRADANQQARNELDKQQRTIMNGFADEAKRAHEMARTLLEIVRWQINPTTTNFPFKAEKNQKDPNQQYPSDY